MSVDYEKLGFTPDEERLLVRMWNHGMMGPGASVWRIVFTNVAITALLVYAVATGSWLAGGLAGAWIAYNTVAASVWTARDVPLWRSVMTKMEALLEHLPPESPRPPDAA